MRKRNNIFLVLFFCVSWLKVLGVTYMTSGKKLYLDVSKQWASYKVFSAYFMSSSVIDAEMLLTKVSDDDNLWEVTVPDTLSQVYPILGTMNFVS